MSITPAPDYNSITSEIMPGVQYTGSLTDGSVMISTPAGKLITQGSQFDSKTRAARLSPVHRSR
ncbi:hypothetical protein [Nocardia gipuzkoensis]|uniref:hypothetical protein n=1 Tax=Nocardia gipuzkoensis TaxID=2749991 RepID=UPI003EE0C031